MLLAGVVLKLDPEMVMFVPGLPYFALKEEITGATATADAVVLKKIKHSISSEKNLLPGSRPLDTVCIALLRCRR